MQIALIVFTWHNGVQSNYCAPADAADGMRGDAFDDFQGAGPTKSWPLA